MGLLQRFRLWWEAIDRSQRVQVIVGSAFFVLVLAGVFVFASRPKMDLLFGGLAPQEYGSVVQELSAKGIPVEYDERGNVSVPHQMKAKALMELATANKLPMTTHKGVESLGDLNAFTSKAQQDEMIKAAKEGELANSIQTLQGVGSALVHINFGKDSPFADDSTPPTAVVNITEQAGATFGKEEGLAIARLVQHAVNGLKSENVVVINSLGQMLYDGANQGMAGNGASTKLEAQLTESKRRERELQSTLDTVFGAGNTVARVDVVLNMDETSEFVDKTTASPDPVQQDTATEEMGGGGAGAVGGISGLAANNPAGLAPATSSSSSSGSGNYTSKVTSSRFAPNVTRQTIKRAAGDVTAMTVNVIANKSAVKDVAAVKQFVTDYLGSKYGDDNFKSSVVETDFDTAAQKADAKAASSAASSAKMQQMLSILPIVALLVVGFMVVKAISKHAPAPIVIDAALSADGSAALPLGQASAAVQMPSEGAAAIVAKRHSEEGEEDDGSIVFEDDSDGPVKVGRIKDKVDVPLEQIRKMALKRPDAVATLLKSWMMEDRK